MDFIANMLGFGLVFAALGFAFALVGTTKKKKERLPVTDYLLIFIITWVVATPVALLTEVYLSASEDRENAILFTTLLPVGVAYLIAHLLMVKKAPKKAKA